MSLIRFEIRYGDGRKEITQVDGERALIGNGAHCDIRLPLDQAANEHVAVEVVGGSVRVETKAFDPPATMNGMPFTNMPITPDVPLKIGSTRIFIALGDAAFEGGAVVQKKAEQTSPLMKVVAIAVLVAGAYMLMSNDEPQMAAAPTQAPELFPPTPTTACPQSAPDQARAFATDKFDRRGEAGAEPVRPEGRRRGGAALRGGERVLQGRWRPGARRGRCAASAKQLRASITQDFRARRVRLEHLLAVGDLDLARNDVKVLRALTEGKQGKYVEWLVQQSQMLKQKKPR